VLVHLLDDIFKTLRGRRIKLPPNLHVQLDNASGTNKNQYLVHYLTSLVSCGIFAGNKIMCMLLPLKVDAGSMVDCPGHMFKNFILCVSRFLQK
jgi:hypothetical protein